MPDSPPAPRSPADTTTNAPSAAEEDAPTVLVVDDEHDVLELVDYNLSQKGFAVVRARNGVEGLEQARALRPDLIVLDVMMPRMDGIEACRQIRRDAHLRTTPILMLTARTDEGDRVEGLDVGADIYLAKPVSMPVLLSQINALLRTTQRYATPPDTLRIHDLEIDRDRYLVYQDTGAADTGAGGAVTEMHFPRKEFELLHFMASHPGKVFSRQELLDEVWGPDVYVVDRTVDVHVRKIREKIGSAYIGTVKGVGYKFVAQPPETE